MHRSLVAIVALVAMAACMVHAELLWPMPQSLSMGSNMGYLSSKQFSFKLSGAMQTNAVIEEAFKRYYDLIFFTRGDSFQAPANSLITSLAVDVASNDLELKMGVDESYELNVNVGQATLTARTIWGALRGLETFSQLSTYNFSLIGFEVDNLPISIIDAPRFAWRGMLVDTARHFYSVKKLMQIIDQLAINKFNVLHWHIVDAQSFPIVSSSFPNLSKASFAPMAVYSHQEVEAIIDYAYLRGIRVVPEFDMPGHAASWGVGYPFMTPSCPNTAASNINLVPLDATNDAIYPFLSTFFQEMRSLFTDSYMHIGGDEVFPYCWAEDKNVANWMQQHNMNMTGLVTYFENKVAPLLQEAGFEVVVWQELLLEKLAPLPQTTVVEAWIHPSDLLPIVEQGYRAILAAGWYLDQQVPGSKTHYEWVDTWKDFYNNDPSSSFTPEQQALVIGGEAAMWSEQVDDANFDSRVWPRAAAVAERLWSSKSVNDVNEAIPRLSEHRCRMVRRGTHCGPIEVGFCPYVYL